MFTAEDVRDLVRLADALDVDVWLEGGWGVDALLGVPTRPHSDVDVVIGDHHADALVAALRERDYRQAQAPFSSPVHSVWKDPDDRVVDLHVVHFDSVGNGLFGDDVYPVEGFRGVGRVGDLAVRCMSPEVQVLFHLGYEHGPEDAHDVLALCAAFDLPVPDQYR